MYWKIKHNCQVLHRTLFKQITCPHQPPPRVQPRSSFVVSKNLIRRPSPGKRLQIWSSILQTVQKIPLPSGDLLFGEKINIPSPPQPPRLQSCSEQEDYMMSFHICISSFVYLWILKSNQPSARSVSHTDVQIIRRKTKNEQINHTN